MPSPVLAATSAARNHMLPIASRTSRSHWLQTLVFGIFFNVAIIALNTSQFIFLPLSFLPSTQPLYEKFVAYTKHSFGVLLVSISQLFAPTTIVLSFTDAQGRPIDAQKFVIRDENRRGPDGLGTVTQVKMPDRSVWISNHQVYVDWLYLWCVAYYANMADSIIIILKASLKKVPFVGWGMQFFRFIFLARNWQADRMPLAKHLSFLAERSHSQHDKTDKKRQDDNVADAKAARASPAKLLLLIFPEGTIFTANTKAQSDKYAQKMGYKNELKYTVLPRSTGLLFCLRALAADIDDLWLVDYTIGYPGIAPTGYGEDYYTLRSVFMQGVPPPRVHLNCIMTRVTAPDDGAKSGPSVDSMATLGGSVAAAAVGTDALADHPPLGRLASSGKASGTKENEPTKEEQECFAAWLRERWAVKDRLMDSFNRDGDFVHGAYTRRLQRDGTQGLEKLITPQFFEIPVELRSPLELGHAFVWGLPVWVAAGVIQGYKALKG
ncbi:acyltransferase-domain-containing protein [Tilletiaria anomala UBC 951]|uniref:Acyltransferase-domain-containing protein n=1 Tax=Tilletiaria anomala (strain ATCC 24038 / CBS 436.72 / UBC 951) TaxID=1037660 RepID=A0A066WNC0_TILAU|nr:acyltransferase-domain-containing protein [Tilletiaria anomala UBC 951]KDN52125.1 acyltransferase-domain-containing protein [Tilletiaria anomala UBC 951]